MKLLYLHHVPLNEDMANIIQVLQMCYAFQQIGVDVTLAVPTNSENMSETEMRRIVYEKIGTFATFKIRRFHHFRIRGRLRAAGAYWGAKSFIKHHPNFEYCFSRSPLIAHLAINAGMKTIYELHGITINAKSKLLDSFYHQLLLRDARSSNMVLFIAISHALAKLWNKKGIPAHKTLVLHDGFPADDYETMIPQSIARKILGIRSDNKIVAYSGSLYKDRGIESILRLAKTFPDANFYIIGGPEENKQFYKVMSARLELSNVFFTGHIPPYQVKNYLFAADVLLMLYTKRTSTINICSPLKAFEYMAAGRIIVGQAFPTIKEIFTDEQNALLSKPDSYGELEKQLQKALLLQYPNELADSARKLAFEKYSWHKRTQHILNILKITNTRRIERQPLYVN